MQELELSLMKNPGYNPEVVVRPLLEEFEVEHHCNIRVKTMSWETGREELIHIALYGKGPDISEIGTTWCPSFISMEALRPFTSREITTFGSASTFFPSSWQSCKLFHDDQMWAIPWLASVRFLYYRKDLLKKAEVDEKTAFISHSHMIQTLKQLRDKGIPTPLALTTRDLLPSSLHTLASFVWGAGGDFITSGGNRTLLNLPETRTGIRNFLELGQYLSPEARGLNEDQAEALFWQGQAAISFTWQIPLMTILEKLATPNVIANLGVALVPGVPFVGGSNLVVWRHVAFSHESLAIELVRFLTSQRVQSIYNSQVGLLPVRPDMMQAPPFSTDAFYQVVAQGLETGRSFHATPRWGVIEDRLLHMLDQLWKKVFTHPEQDIDTLIAEELDPLAKRLDLML